MMVKSGLEFFIFLIQQAPSEIPANQPGQFSLSGQTFLHWTAATLKGLAEFHFLPSFFLVKKCQFQDSRF
jgi:hypothetical protein